MILREDDEFALDVNNAFVRQDVNVIHEVDHDESPHKQQDQRQYTHGYDERGIEGGNDYAGYQQEYRQHETPGKNVTGALDIFHRKFVRRVTNITGDAQRSPKSAPRATNFIAISFRVTRGIFLICIWQLCYLFRPGQPFERGKRHGVSRQEYRLL